MEAYISKMYKTLNGDQYYGLYSADNNLIYMNKSVDQLKEYADKLGIKEVKE